MSGGGFIDNVVDAVVDPVKDAGSWIDDKVNEEIPGGWYTVAAVTGATLYGAEAIAAGNAAESAALAEGATAAEAASAGASAAASTEAAVAGTTDYLGSQALGSASTGAVGSGGTGIGLTTSTAGTGLNTGALGGMEYLGGAGTLSAGTAGLTAEQIAQAELAGQVGSNASSGLGYLGGAEALPSGTAGITGVTAPTSLSISDAQRALRLGQTLFGQQPQTASGFPQRQIQPYGVVDYSPTLSLLQQRATTPNVYSLLG